MRCHKIFIALLQLQLTFGVYSQGQLTILEGDSVYEQKIHYEKENNFVIIDVPAHNNIVHSRTFIDFNSVISNFII